MLIEYNPWAMVIGSDTPTLAVYEDGSVIFVKKESEEKYGLYTTSIDLDGHFIQSITPENLGDLKESYTLSDWTDQPTNLFVWKEKHVAIYGNMNEVKEKLPKGMWEVYSAIKSFDSSDAKEWLPDYIEVMLWPYEYAPDESIVWPDGWPDLEHATTKKRSKDSFSIYLPSEHFDELKSLLKTRKQKGALLISGKKMAVSYRFPFPHDKLWKQ